MAIAVIQARDEGDSDQRNGSYGSDKKFAIGSTLQIGLTRLAGGLDGGAERKHWAGGNILPKLEKTGIRKSSRRAGGEGANNCFGLFIFEVH